MIKKADALARAAEAERNAVSSPAGRRIHRTIRAVIEQHFGDREEIDVTEAMMANSIYLGVSTAFTAAVVVAREAGDVDSFFHGAQ